MERTPTIAKLQILTPTGPEMIRMYHRNIVANDRELSTPSIAIPPLITRAKLVVRESREIVVSFKVDVETQGGT